MAHIDPKKLSDLEPVLSVIREWPRIKERKPGIFYFGSIPFLHFHENDGRRLAHIKSGKEFKEIKIEFDAKKNERSIFLDQVEKFYRRF